MKEETIIRHFLKWERKFFDELEASTRSINYRLKRYLKAKEKKKKKKKWRCVMDEVFGIQENKGTGARFSYMKCTLQCDDCKWGQQQTKQGKSQNIF